MNGSYRRRSCKCPKGKRCSCGAKWSYRIDLPPDAVTGDRRQREKGGFNTRAEAVAAATKIYAELTQGTYVAEKDTLFKDFAPEWLKIYQATGQVKAGTVQVRASRLKTIQKYFSNVKLKDISKKMYQDMLIDLKNKGYAHETIVSVQATGRLLFKKAKQLELIKTNPTEYAVIPIVQKSVEELENEQDIPKYLEKEELAKFLTTAREHGHDKDYIVFLTLAYTGCRIGELCVLTWKDIDTDQQTISITKTLYNQKNNVKEYKLQPPKTKKSKRVIEVDQVVLKELEKHRATQNEIRILNRKTYYDKDFVFVKKDQYLGYPEFPKNVEARMKRLLKIAGLDDSLTPHSLRHTHTSLLAEAGVSLEQIMDRLGHQSDDITRRVYLHITKSKKKEASQKFAELMRSL